jgi:hypothetical protein
VFSERCSENFAKKFESKISSAFSEKELNALAERTGFKIRQSKLTPTMFVDTLLFKEMDNGTVSLEDHCIALRERYNVTVKKQSLAERFDVTAVKFIRELLNRHLSNQICLTVEKEKLGNLFQHFSSIKIKDSTRFQVSECLKEYYPGSTGAATGAGVHIQFEFDILNGLVSDLSVTDALQQDMTNAKQTAGEIQKGSLIIRDLGYFSTSVLEHIGKQKAYYITRAKSRMNFIHADSGRTINFNALYQQMKRNKLDRMEIPVVVGNQKLGNRLIIEMLPEKEVQRRIAKANREAEKKGRNLSAEYRSRARLNLFITNVPVEWIATSQIRKMYQLRWQIELRFKAWKSFYDIDATKKMQRYRFECYLYSTLLLLMINLEIANNFFAILWTHTSKPLSLLKFYKTTSQNMANLRRAIIEKGEALLKYLAFLYEISRDKLLTEKRKNHSGSLSEIFGLNVV